MKKPIFLLVVLILTLLCCSAAADTLTLPASLTEIEEEAFLGDTSITEVVLPERLEVIGDRAFMDCDNLQAIHIPASVWSIGQDALPPQALVICEPYSAAENYAIEHSLQYEYEKHYAIGDIWVSEEGEAFIQVTTGDACTLRVEILDSDRQTVLFTGTAPCEERLDGGSVSVLFEGLPEYFALRAVLVDGAGSALCAPVLWLERLDPYQEFENKQPGDFSGGRVLDYGENGFAVFRDDVREVAGTESGGLYTVQSEEEIYDWDRLYIPSLNAVVIARNVTDNGDGTYTLSAYGGDEIGLESFFQYVNYHATLDGTSGAAGTEYADSVQSPRGTGEVRRFKKTLTVGSVTAQATMGLTITCNLRYDAALFGDWHMECDLYTDADASLSLTATQEYSFEREIPLFVGTVPTDIPGLLVTMDLSLPMELYARAEASASAQINSRVGFRYNSDSGYETIREGDAGWDLSAKAEVGAKIGPKVSLGLSFLRLVTASVSGSVGCEFQAVAEKSLSSHDEVNPDRKHACDLCLDVTVNRFVRVNAGLYALGEDITEANLYEDVAPIFEGYLSVLNDAESPLGGRMTLAAGECPNYKYRATLRVEDPDAPEDVKQAAIYRRVNQVERARVGQGDAPLTAYLYPGSYQAESEHLGATETLDFEIDQEPLDLLMDFTLIPIDEAHFPDAGFRDYVAYNYDLDGDLLLNGWERSRVRTMHMIFPENDPDWQIHFPAHCTSLEGIRYFTEVDNIYFDCWYGGIDRIDLSHNTKLTQAELWFVGPDGVDVSGCAALRELTIKGGGVFDSLDLSGCPALEYLDVDDLENLTELDLSHNHALWFLRVDSCPNLTSLDLSGHSALEAVNLNGCGLTSLNLNGCTSLEALAIEYTRLSYLDLTICPRILTVDIANVPGMTLNVSHKHGLIDIEGRWESVAVGWLADQNQRIYFAEGVAYGVYENGEWFEHYPWQ